MALRKLTILAPNDKSDILDMLESNEEIVQYWCLPKLKGQPNEINVLAESDDLQELMDKLQTLFSKDKDWRIIMSPVEATLPKLSEKTKEQKEADKEKGKKAYGSLTREELYDKIFKGCRTNNDFVILTVLAAVVTAIGLITSNVAVIIGAMVIAPLLGPNLALSFGTTLGDKAMIKESLKSSAVGFSITLIMSLAVGVVISSDIFADSPEYLARTQVGYDGVLLALASGAAAVLSLTSGISSAMVGVMVAVALMPPAVTMGMAFGSGLFADAYGAALLLAINVICVNLAAKSVFILKGIRPRTWYMRKKSKQSLRLSFIIWNGLLVLLMALIYLWKYN